MGFELLQALQASLWSFEPWFLLQEGSGKRVMGSAKNAIATKVATRPDLVWEVPQHWSLAEAATVPTAYMTAYYSLVMRGRLRKGMRVLIHSGTGAVGLAAIQISLTRGAEVSTLRGRPCLSRPILTSKDDQQACRIILLACQDVCRDPCTI